MSPEEQVNSLPEEIRKAIASVVKRAEIFFFYGYNSEDAQTTLNTLAQQIEEGKL